MTAPPPRTVSPGTPKTRKTPKVPRSPRVPKTPKTPSGWQAYYRVVRRIPAGRIST